MENRFTKIKARPTIIKVDIHTPHKPRKQDPIQKEFESLGLTRTSTKTMIPLDKDSPRDIDSFDKNPLIPQKCKL